MKAQHTHGRIELLRLWFAKKLLGAAWLALPGRHPARHGIFDAGCALQDPQLTINLQRNERAAFEVWAQASGFCIHRDDSEKYRDYHRATTRWAWDAWLARAAITQATTKENT